MVSRGGGGKGIASLLCRNDSNFLSDSIYMKTRGKRKEERGKRKEERGKRKERREKRKDCRIFLSRCVMM